MQTTRRFTAKFAGLASISRVVLGGALGLLPSCAVDDGGAVAEPPLALEDAPIGDEASSVSVCSAGPIRCLSRIRTVGTGATRRIHANATAPTGLGAIDLQAAYNIDPSRTATPRPTIAIVDAYGYTKLEADLAVYRAQYRLPPCTTANGCLKIVNQLGQPSPLPPNPPANDDWTVETALDVDMASAACPLCNILVVQANDNAGDGLYVAQNAAAALGATVISDSWGAPEVTPTTPGVMPAGLVAVEQYFNHPNVAIFVAAGDAGYDDQFSPAAQRGPGYPGTSQYVIAVGATRLVRAANARGWSETTWAPLPVNPPPPMTNAAGGSACSLSVPKPAYQAASPCRYRASADIAAVGDPATGLAVYNTNGTNPGWISLGGTSASAPFVAGIFAATGNGKQTSGAFIAANAAKLWDVTSGTNGTCAPNTLLCTAAVGWDGPTGFGTPNAGALMTIGAAAGPGTAAGGDDITGGCSTGGATGGAGTGLALGLALVSLRRRRR